MFKATITVTNMPYIVLVHNDLTVQLFPCILFLTYKGEL